MSFRSAMIMITSALVTGAAFAQAPAAPGPSFKIGDTWRFTNRDLIFNKEVTYLETVDEIKGDLVVIVAGSTTTTHEADGTLLTYKGRSGETRYEKGYPKLVFPLTEGATWDRSYPIKSNGNSETARIQARVVAFESKTVPAGTFEAYKVEATITFTGGTAYRKLTYWYAPTTKRIIDEENTRYVDGRRYEAQRVTLIAVKIQQ